jgi:2,3-bisphosphoglycerate-dependent phosphoglycerate mutase
MSVTRSFQRPFVLPEDARQLVLARHGATDGRSPGGPFMLVGGHDDPPLLVPHGRNQALALAAHLQVLPISRVWVSPLRRTHETAAPYINATGLELEQLDELREVFLGEWEGGLLERHIAARDPIALRVFQEQRWDVIPGAEPADEFGARIAKALRWLFEATARGATTLAIAHGAVIAEACRQITGSEPFAFVGAENGSVTRLVQRATGKLTIRSFNESQHLAEVNRVMIQAVAGQSAGS